MLRVAKSCRRGYREFSSASEKDMTTSKKVVEKLVGFGFKMTVFGVGYLMAGMISSPVAKPLQEAEEFLMESARAMDEHEVTLEALMKKYNN